MKKNGFLNFFECYWRWKGMLAPGAPAALRVCSIICLSCPWRWALCEEEQKKTFFFLNNGFLFKKPLFLIKKRFFLNFFEFYSDMTVVYHLLAHYSAPTTSGEVFRPLCTKSDLLTIPRDWFTSKKALRRPKWARNCYFGDAPQVIWPWFITYWLTTALPQHPERCSAHFGPSLSS